MKTLIEMALSVVPETDQEDAHGYKLLRLTYSEIERFAELVRADEREACVQDIQMHIPRSGRDTTEYQMAMRMIERIRARSNT
jgi:hypothetical protein